MIKVTNLTKRYGDKTAVDDLSLNIKKGEIFGLIGPNGSGKSTAIECILGTKKLDYGEVAILDLEPVKNRKKLFENVGVQFQESACQDKITVKELCEQTSCLYTSKCSYMDLLYGFNLDDKLNSFVNTLSGGEKQRLFVVQALIRNPKVLFLDEPTTGHDPHARRIIWQYLKGLKERGITILLTSHFMDEVENLCDRIGILKSGKLIFIGTPAEALLACPGKSLEDVYLMLTEGEQDI